MVAWEKSKGMMKIRKLTLAFVDNGLLTLKALSLLFSFSCSLKSSWRALTEFSILSVERGTYLLLFEISITTKHGCPCELGSNDYDIFVRTTLLPSSFLED